MNFIQILRYKNFSKNEHTETLIKEFFRKTIHLCSSFVALFAKYFFNYTLIVLILITILYIIFEILRINGKKIFLISDITKFASRKRDKSGFVLGPVTLSIGIIITLLLYPLQFAQIGILALAFGDGLASLVGKCFGKKSLSLFPSKTLEGCLTCFFAVFISTAFLTKSILHSLIIASIATIVEVLPLKNFDNLFIPIICSVIALLLNL